MQKVETEISKAFGGGSAAEAAASGRRTSTGRKTVGFSKNVPAARKTTPKRVKRGAVKELILAGLREAGEAGIAVKHLAAKLAIKPQNIHVWLHTTGKKGGLVEAAGKGVYRLKEAVGVKTPSRFVEAPKPTVTATLRKATKTGKGRKKAKL